MATVTATSILSHWDQMFEGMQQSSNEFYGQVEQGLAAHHLKDTKLERINISEGGLFSAKREYLQVRRGIHVFHVCAAPFGNGFFVSWWLGVAPSFFASLARIPLIGLLFRAFIQPLTYYKIDTALMFQAVTHGAVMSALDAVINAKGMRALSETERQPIKRDLFNRLG
jgi:hypothetical protein